MKRKSETGQAIVFLVLGLVVFMGFVALAIDGGRVYADRRHVQNSADAASLAGGSGAATSLEGSHVLYTVWNCNASTIQSAMQVARQKAVERAASNGFNLDDAYSDTNGISVTCGQKDYGYIDKFMDVEVRISATTETSFAQLFFPGLLENRVSAITRVRPRTPLAYGHAIVALNPAACQGTQNGVTFGGDGKTVLHGGGIWSNGCLRVNGQPSVKVTGGDIIYVGNTKGNMGIFDPAPHQSAFTLPPDSTQLTKPNCNDTGVHHSLSANLQPGLYCINGNVKMDDISGTGVTIVIDGDLTVNGDAKVDLTAPKQVPDPKPAVAGLLFYVTGDIKINGNSDQGYLGLIYAPNGYCKLDGTGDTWGSMHTQVICWDVEVTGKADLDINFNGAEQYQKPTTIELYK